MTLTYNVNHLQVAPKGATPVYIDVDGAISAEPTISSDKEDVLGDGQVWATIYKSPTGEMTLTWLKTNFAVMAAINGGDVSSSGTGAAAIDRYEQPSAYVAPSVIVSYWEPNVAPDRSPDEAGLRTTIPNATFGVAKKASGQETVGEWSADGSFRGSSTGPMIIYELLASEPVFTAGVMPTNVIAPV